ncbi:MAG: Ig-like domain-containing protein [Endomicrobium sp.]|nr:Ig-like domain-containing protein [Endomicrobium sp.]
MLQYNFNNTVSNATVNIIVLEGAGNITSVTNNNDGTYSAQLNSSTKGNVTVGFTANGAQSSLNHSRI